MTLTQATAQIQPQFAETAIQTGSQPVSDTAQGSVPRLIRFSGTLATAEAKPGGLVGVEFAIYKEESGGVSLWLEIQNVQVDSSGHFTVLLGVTKNGGLRPDVLGTGEPRWLSVTPVGGQPQPRALLVSVPYALRAEEAMKLGGSSAEEFVRKQDLQQAVHETLVAATGGGSETQGIGRPEIAEPTNNAATSGPSTFAGSTTTTIVAVQQTGSGSALAATATSGGAISGVGGGYGISGKATSSSGSGVVGDASATTGLTIGIKGTAASPTGFGVQGAATATSGESTGVSGTAASPTGYGVQGFATATTGTAVGVSGNTAAPQGNAVQGIATSKATGTTGANGVYGLSYSPVGYGVWGYSNTNVGVLGSTGGGASSYGVEGSSTAGTGVLGVGAVGVAGHAVSGGLSGLFQGGPFKVAGDGNYLLAGDPGCGAGFAGVGFLHSGNMSGCTNYALIGDRTGGTYVNSSGTATIHFRSNNNELVTIDNSGNVDVIGQNGGGKLTVAGQTKISTANSGGALVVTNTASGTGVQGTAGEGRGGIFVNNSTTFAALQAQNNADNKTEAFWAGGGPPKFGVCTIDTSGNLLCLGSKSAVVPVDRGARKVALYAVEAPENWFEDIGSGQLSNGSARIDLDPIFAQTVNTGVEYHVFLTPKGDCKGLYVGNESAASFEVHELGGGTSNIAFDYRIVAKRSGYENIRLEDFTERFNRLEAQRAELWRSTRAQSAAIESAPAPKPADASVAKSGALAVPTHAIQGGK
ncbi:MAG: hypothetical protein ACLPWF_07640 [Bryobacteraceae bacterium]